MKNDLYAGQYVWATVGGVRLHMPGSLGESELAGQRDFTRLGVSDPRQAALQFTQLSEKHFLRVLHHEDPFRPFQMNFSLLLLMAFAFLITCHFWQAGNACVTRNQKI